MCSSEVVVVERVRQSVIALPAEFARARPRWGVLLAVIAPFAVVGVASLVVVFMVGDRWRPIALIFAFMMVGANFLLLMLMNAHRRVAWGGLRVGPDDGIKLVGDGFGGMLPLLGGLCWTCAGVVAAWTRMTPGVVAVGSAGRAGFLLPLCLGLGCVAVAITKKFLPSSIRISADSIAVRQGIMEHRVAWSEVIGVSVTVSDTKIARLQITCGSRSSFSLLATHFGSNPHFVAELLAYYMRTPTGGYYYTNRRRPSVRFWSSRRDACSAGSCAVQDAENTADGGWKSCRRR